MKAITVNQDSTKVVVGFINGKVGDRNNILPLYKIFHDPQSAEIMNTLGITADNFRYVDVSNCNYDGDDITTVLPLMPLDLLKGQLETSDFVLEAVPVLTEGEEAAFTDLELDGDTDAMKASLSIEGLTPDEVVEICHWVDNLLFSAAVTKSSDEYKNQYKDNILKWILSDCFYIYDSVWPAEFKEYTTLISSPKHCVVTRDSEESELSFSIAPLRLLLLEQIVSSEKTTSDHTTHFDDSVTSLLSSAAFALPDIETADGNDEEAEVMKLQMAAGTDYNSIFGISLDGSPVINDNVIPVKEKVTPFSDVYPFINIPDEAFYGTYTSADILGHPEKNSSPNDIVRDYERNLFEKLKRMCLAELVVTTGNFNIEDSIGKKIPTACNEYIKTLITQAMVKNYMYTGIVSSVDISEDESDEETDKTVESVYPFRLGTIEAIGDFASTPNDFQLKPKFEPDADIKEVENYVEQIPNLGLGTSTLFNFLKTTTTCPYAFAEALVQLIRYGKEKPTCLAITDAKYNDRTVYWDIVNCCSSSFNGNISTLQRNCPEGSESNIFIEHLCALNTSTLPTEFRELFKSEFSLITEEIPDSLIVGATIREEWLDEEGKPYNFFKLYDIFALYEAVSQGLFVNNLEQTEDIYYMDYDTAINYFTENGITITQPSNEIRTIMAANNFKKKNLNLLTLMAEICSPVPEYAKYILNSAIKVKNNEVASFSKSIAELAIFYHMLPKVVSINLNGNFAQVFNSIPVTPSVFSQIKFNPDLDSIFMENPKAVGAIIIPLEYNGNIIGYSAHLKWRDIYHMFLFTSDEFDAYKKKVAQKHSMPIAEVFTNNHGTSTLEGKLKGLPQKDYWFAIDIIEKANNPAIKQSLARVKFVGATTDTVGYFKQYK